ncbi:MAG TPA: ABC transporter ATP-binding protein [Ktedonobacteraceae bacterium]|nr:ABC transporter ATP-binding protein [Ktedonobacteraceae bacterium]
MAEALLNGNRAEAQTNTLLEVKHLSVDYLAASGVVHAVNDVSITLARGEILGLAGESGCGKSTLAYAIARLLRPPALITEGEVLYYPRTRVDEAGVQRVSTVSMHKREPRVQNLDIDEAEEAVDIMKMGAAELRAFRWTELAIVFQSAMNALNPVMKIGTQIMDVLQAHRPEMGPDARRQRALELLRLVGIAPDRINSYPHELSGGMRQRAIIAIALALSPEIIIMDEPTTALDVVMQREILIEITRLREQLGFSVIFITHDLSLLLELADKIAIMYAGRIVEQGSSFDLYDHPRHPYSYGLLHSFPTIRGPRRNVTGIPGSPPDLRAVPTGCAFNPRCPFAFAPCTGTLPTLSVADPEISEQLVACHLYNPELHPAGAPVEEEFAERYASLSERSKAS